MKRIPLFVLLLLLVPVAAAQDASVPAEGLSWKPFEQAVQAADEKEKYVLIDIYAPWCGWCSKMQKEVYTDEEVQTYLDEHFVLTRLDASARQKEHTFRGRTMKAPQLANALGMRGTPTTVFLRSDGTYLARRPGFVPVEDFLQMLRFIGSDAHEEQSFEEYRGAQ